LSFTAVCATGIFTKRPENADPFVRFKLESAGPRLARVTFGSVGGVPVEGTVMESQKRILTITEVAEVLRCSKTHVKKALNGRVPGVPQMAHLTLGRRKLVPSEWFDEWLSESRRRIEAAARANEVERELR